MSNLSKTLRQLGNNRAITADGLLVDARGKPIENAPFLGIAFMGDMHLARSSGDNLDTTSADSIAAFQASVATVIANKELWNVKLFMMHGDQTDGVNTENGIEILVEQVELLIANGIYPIMCSGNHDPIGSSGAGAYWVSDLNVAWLQRVHPYFTGITRAGYSNEAIYYIENGPLRLGIITGTPVNGSWVQYAAGLNPTVPHILVTHQFIDCYGYLTSSENLPYVKASPNIVAVICGHWRSPFTCAHSFLLNDYGRVVTGIYMNNQHMRKSGNNYFRIMRVYDSHADVSTYDTELDRFIANGEAASLGSGNGTELGYYANFSFPMMGLELPEVGSPFMPFPLPQLVQNTAYAPSGALNPSPNDPTMTESLGSVQIPFASTSPDGVAKTWSLATTGTRPTIIAT